MLQMPMVLSLPKRYFLFIEIATMHELSNHLHILYANSAHQTHSYIHLPNDSKDSDVSLASLVGIVPDSC